MEISPALQTWLNEQGFSSVDRNLDGFMCGETALHKAVKLHGGSCIKYKTPQKMVDDEKWFSLNS